MYTEQQIIEAARSARFLTVLDALGDISMACKQVAEEDYAEATKHITVGYRACARCGVEVNWGHIIYEGSIYCSARCLHN